MVILCAQYVISEKRHYKSLIIYIEYTCCVICRILYQCEKGSASSFATNSFGTFQNER